ncbi:MAG: T9SS type A sorting domain-containing protein [Fibrobacteraceae bacterium]|nr:T9SS type A sorting domain-containing protein [Fibrobacteraceae bacterium]
MFGLVVATALVASAAPKYPFPQNKKSPHGYTFPYADTKMIKEHFDKWKDAWYKDQNDGSAWILSPEGDCSTVSEGIAYGMMIMVYMSSNGNDYQSEFDKLYATWKKNGGNGAGMNWRVGCKAGSGSATDADVDAALALVMASKQWDKSSYLDDAKAIMSWMATNDISGGHVKPGSGWNEAFNPSYGTLANFELFSKVAGGSWSNVVSTAGADLLACQDPNTGLVPDWCDWNSHKPTRTSAAVSQDEDPGFYDDAARTPWRTAWAYYWYGNSNAKKFNDKITKWLYGATYGDAGGINSGYTIDGKKPDSETRNFVSSTFSGGLGLASSSDDSETGNLYMGTVYKALASFTSAAGPSAKVGEQYYPATLNILYLLLMTGNMPNLYDMTGFTDFTPDPSAFGQITMPAGTQQKLKDSTVGLSGFWNWGAYHDKYGVTIMRPDSGSSPLFNNAGVITAEAEMNIAPEPDYESPEGQAGKYPSAGIAMSFLSNEEQGIDLTALGAKSVRINVSTQGTIRFALLSSSVKEAGGEPGYMIEPTNGYKTITLDMTPSGLADFGDFTTPDWVKQVVSGNDVMKTVKGLKFEAKMPKGGYGKVSVKSIEFLDASGNVIDPEKITGIKIAEATNPGIGQGSSGGQGGGTSTGTQGGDPSTGTQGGDPNTGTQGGDPNTGNQGGDPNQGGSIAIHGVNTISAVKISTMGQAVQISNAKVGTTYAIFDMQGKVITVGQVLGATHSVTIPTKGMYMVRVGSEMKTFSIK